MTKVSINSTHSILRAITSNTWILFHTVRFFSVKESVFFGFKLIQICHWYFLRLLIISQCRIDSFTWVLDQNWTNLFSTWICVLSLAFYIGLRSSSKVVLSNCLMVRNWWSWLNTLTHNRINFMVWRRWYTLDVCAWLIWYFLHRSKILCRFMLFDYCIIFGWRISFKEIDNFLYNLFASDFMMLLFYVLDLFWSLIIFKDSLSVSVFHHLIIFRSYE